MSERIAIVGIGATQFRTLSPDVSYKEMMFEAATKAYCDAGIDPRKDVGTFVTCAEDYIEGVSIFDEYVPDQLGAVLRPTQTISGDGLHGIGAAWMQLMTGCFEVAVVEAHVKASNLMTPAGIAACAQDPVFVRPLCFNTLFVAGLEMNRYCHETGVTAEQCARVAIKNRANALSNPLAARAADLTLADFAHSAPVAAPLTEIDIAHPADGAVVIVLATESRARSLNREPVWVSGIGWCNGSSDLEARDWATPEYVAHAGEMACRMAGINNPRTGLDFAEIDDTYSYKELQHLAALRICPAETVGEWSTGGATEPDGEFPVNVSGGALGMGHLHEAMGLARLYCAVEQLRGEAGAAQIPEVERCLVQAWRGVPTASAATAVLEV
jgi:acetyl-CoA C-acetyltransferase